LTKTETFRHMAEYCHNSCSKCPPFALIHARKHPRHAKHAENAVSVHNTCLDKLYLQRIFNRKLKQISK